MMLVCPFSLLVAFNIILYILKILQCIHKITKCIMYISILRNPVKLVSIN